MMNHSSHELVVLLHGIRKKPRAMNKLARFLDELGYVICNLGYPSTSFSIEELADHVYQQLQETCPSPYQKIHFVSHSMGGIIIRILLSKYHFENLGRVVMIAPPHKGSEVADFLSNYKFYKKIFGPAGQQLGTGEKSFGEQLGPINYDLGIIAGDRTLDPWFSWFILPDKGDGKVTVESTKLEGMKDHMIIPASHFMISRKKETLWQVAYFLRHASFDKNKIRRL